MANPKIDLRPARLDLFLYAGDGARIKLNCRTSEEDDAPTVDMSGTMKAQIRLSHTSTGAPIVEIIGDMTDAATGIVWLPITAEQTQTLIDDPSVGDGGVFKGVWDVEWTPTDTDPRTIIQGLVECGEDVTR